MNARLIRRERDCERERAIAIAREHERECVTIEYERAIARANATRDKLIERARMKYERECMFIQRVFARNNMND